MNRNKFELIFNFLLLPLDAAMIFLAFWLAFLVRFTGWVPFTSVMSQTEYLRWLIVLITSGRLLARIILKIMYYRGHGQRLVLIIGTTRIARKIIREFSDKYLGYRVVGIISTNLTPDKHFVHIPVLGKLKELDRIVKEYRIKEIILADPDLSEK